MKQEGILEILHFTGSQIYRNADACARQVERRLQTVIPSVPHYQLDELDESQRKALEQPLGPVRFLAPAGAGKTRVLVNRVVKLINDGVPPESILLLAFNTKAREQMIQKLNEKNVPVTKKLDKSGVAVHTFNSFGHWYLSEALNGWELENSKGFWRDVLERSIKEIAPQLIITKLHQDPLVDAYIKAIERVKRDLVHPNSELVELTDRNNNPIPAFPIQQVLDVYQRKQNQVGKFNFDDQIYLTLERLLVNPLRRQELQRRFEHILLDEFQDLNAAQLALIDILSRPQWSLYAVGDDD